jgi:hypothetical protein
MPSVHRPDLDEHGERDGLRWRGERVGIKAGSERLGASLYHLPPGEATTDDARDYWDGEPEVPS